MKKQTAVEFLGHELNVKLFYDISPELWEQVNDIFKQAIAMEKEQIIEAYNTGELHCVTDPRTSLDYYQHHYGS